MSLVRSWANLLLRVVDLVETARPSEQPSPPFEKTLRATGQRGFDPVREISD
jgi:hypothetical protein